MKRINCRRCQHYFVTWEPKKPHGCKAYGFKSHIIPSMVVFQSSGIDCHMFMEKSNSDLSNKFSIKKDYY